MKLTPAGAILFRIVSAPVRFIIWALALGTASGSPSSLKTWGAILLCWALHLYDKDNAMYATFLATLGAAMIAGHQTMNRVIDKISLNLTGQTVAQRSLSLATNVNLTGDVADAIKAIKARRDTTLGQEDSGRVPQVHND